MDETKATDGSEAAALAARRPTNGSAVLASGISVPFDLITDDGMRLTGIRVDKGIEHDDGSLSFGLHFDLEPDVPIDILG